MLKEGEAADGWLVPAASWGRGKDGESLISPGLLIGRLLPGNSVPLLTTPSE